MAKTTKKRDKFNIDNSKKGKAKRTHGGILYDSELELRFFKEWILPQVGSGNIVKYDRQVDFELQEKFQYNKKNIPSIKYVADYVVTFKNGHIQVIDVKGQPDAVAKLKRKMFWFKYPAIDYVWYSYSKMDGGWVFWEDIDKARKLRKKEKNKETK